METPITSKTMNGLVVSRAKEERDLLFLPQSHKIGHLILSPPLPSSEVQGAGKIAPCQCSATFLPKDPVSGACEQHKSPPPSELHILTRF